MLLRFLESLEITAWYPFTCRSALQALLPEALVPLTLLEPDGRALLCGDPKCAHRALLPAHCSCA